ncbi:hypothetical protein H5410_047892 [Solanum commersonii]|uniref:Uncharacterized protein n=1 Tax=Solanum commersonii TaxID=4109 RepID=A0A9J5XIF1_SOLCO|nr:hypothetical protein H5410_047892 [Solanum commersonii]
MVIENKQQEGQKKEQEKKKPLPFFLPDQRIQSDQVKPPFSLARMNQLHLVEADLVILLLQCQWISTLGLECSFIMITKKSFGKSNNGTNMTEETRTDRKKLRDDDVELTAEKDSAFRRASRWCDCEQRTKQPKNLNDGRIAKGTLRPYILITLGPLGESQPEGTGLVIPPSLDYKKRTYCFDSESNSKQDEKLKIAPNRL